MSAVPARQAHHEHLAEVIPIFRNRGYAPRRPRNGHHEDCPYPSTDPQWCTICAAIRKGANHR